jgi:hypothetical protein
VRVWVSRPHGVDLVFLLEGSADLPLVTGLQCPISWVKTCMWAHTANAVLCLNPTWILQELSRRDDRMWQIVICMNKT